MPTKYLNIFTYSKSYTYSIWSDTVFNIEPIWCRLAFSKFSSNSFPYFLDLSCQFCQWALLQRSQGNHIDYHYKNVHINVLVLNFVIRFVIIPSEPKRFRGYTASKSIWILNIFINLSWFLSTFPRTSSSFSWVQFDYNQLTTIFWGNSKWNHEPWCKGILNFVIHIQKIEILINNFT